MSRSRSNKMPGLTGLVAGTGVCLAVVSVTIPAGASVMPDDPPVAASTVPAPGYDHTYNYPNYDPRYDVQPVEHSDSIHTTSVALGALGGIALAGAGLGITLGLQRRRDHTALHSA